MDVLHAAGCNVSTASICYSFPSQPDMSGARGAVKRTNRCRSSIVDDMLVSWLFPVVIYWGKNHFSYRNFLFLDFSWKRAILRTVIVLFILFVCQSVHRFSPIITLVGGSTGALICMILPGSFYLKLISLHGSSRPLRQEIYSILYTVR